MFGDDAVGLVDPVDGVETIPVGEPGHETERGNQDERLAGNGRLDPKKGNEVHLCPWSSG